MGLTTNVHVGPLHPQRRRFNPALSHLNEVAIKMQINNLLLSLAVPAAARTVQQAASVAHHLGSSFARVLTDSPPISGSTGGEAKVEASGENEFNEKLAAFSDQLQSFLEQNGIFGDFKLKMEVDSSGQPSAAASGSEAARVIETLNQNPAWLERLGQLAAAIKGKLPHLNISITDQGSSHWTSL